MDSNLDEIKNRIEQRYKRLKAGRRRPSTEYISPQDVLEVFMPFVKDPDQFAKKSNLELLAFYDQWHKEVWEKENRTESLDFPELGDDTP